jgi:hypothetical protein
MRPSASRKGNYRGLGMSGVTPLQVALLPVFLTGDIKYSRIAGICLLVGIVYVGVLFPSLGLLALPFLKKYPALGSQLLIGLLSKIVIVCVYRLTLHPLARYPGPLLAKLSPLYAVHHALIGDIHLDVQRCHEEYGTFVRYGPNSLVINSVNGFYGTSPFTL